MGEVRVGSTDAIKQMRVALVKFAEACNTALGDAESDGNRTLNWLQGEAKAHWRQQIRQRQDQLNRAKEALRMKQLYKSPTGGRQSYVDEQKAVTLAARRLEEAVAKDAAVQRSTGVLARALTLYKGSVGRLTASVQADVPAAVVRLGVLIERIEDYTLAASGPADTVAAGAGVSMAREPAGASMGELPQTTDTVAQAPTDETQPKLTPAELAAAMRERAQTLATIAGLAGLEAPEEAAVAVLPDLEPADRVRLGMLAARYRPPDPAVTWVAAEPMPADAEVAVVRTAADGRQALVVLPVIAASARPRACVHSAALWLAGNPGIEPLTRLPTGFVVIMQSGRVLAALGPRDEDLWPGLLGQAG